MDLNAYNFMNGLIFLVLKMFIIYLVVLERSRFVFVCVTSPSLSEWLCFTDPAVKNCEKY